MAMSKRDYVLIADAFAQVTPPSTSTSSWRRAASQKA